MCLIPPRAQDALAAFLERPLDDDAVLQVDLVRILGKRRRNTAAGVGQRLAKRTYFGGRSRRSPEKSISLQMSRVFTLSARVVELHTQGERDKVVYWI